MKKIFLIILLSFIFNRSSVKAINAKSYIDYPEAGSYSGQINISGWIMSDTEITSIKAYIDSKKIDFNYERIEREDVNRVIKGYGNNPKPGFSGIIHAQDISDNIHNLKLEFYSDKLLINTISKTFNYKRKAQMCIDYPNSKTQGIKTNIQGWLMSTDAKYELKTYIDNNEVTINYTKVEREDVLKAIKDYPEEINMKPGFKSEIDLSNYSNGKHILKIDVLDSDNKIITSSSKSFYLDKYKSTSYIDYPSDRDYFGTMYIKGWIMSNIKIDSIKAYVDNKPVKYSYERSEREDVIKAIKGYPKEINIKPGFEGLIDISSFEEGSHKLKLEFINNEEIINVKEKNFNIKKKTQMCIDYPNSKTQGTKINIQGWIMSTDAEYKLKTYIDNNEVTTNYTKVEREDVLKAIKDYPEEINMKPGFKSEIDLSNYSDGNHILKIEAIDSNNNIVTSVKSFYLDKYRSLMYIDSPFDNSSINGTNISLKGWFLTHLDNTNLKVTIDEKDISNLVKMVPREDVIKIYGKEFNKNNSDLIGFDFNVPLTDIKDGEKTIKFEILNNTNEETILVKTEKISLKKYKTYMDIEDPTENYILKGTELTIRGWTVSTSNNKRLQLIVNDTDISNKISYAERYDVYKEYGKEFNLSQTDKVGFNTDYDVSNIEDGVVSIKLNVIDIITEEIIGTINRKLILKKYIDSNEGYFWIENNNGKVIDTENNTITFQEKNNSLSQIWKIEKINNYYQIKPSSNPKKCLIDKGEIVIDKCNGTDNELWIIDNQNNEYFKIINKGNNIPLNYSFTSLNNDNNQDFKLINYSDVKTYKGIDISKWQGIIDWNILNKENPNFIIMRIGTGRNNYEKDTNFETYYKNASYYSIPIGGYMYSFAKSLTEAKKEANLTLEWLGGKELDLPIFYDIENISQTLLSKDDLTLIAETYCLTIMEAGYHCGIYANKYFLNDNLDAERLSNNYPIWLAHYTGANNYNDVLDEKYHTDYSLTPYKYWQFTSQGTYKSITENTVDLDLGYDIFD